MADGADFDSRSDSSIGSESFQAWRRKSPLNGWATLLGAIFQETVQKIVRKMLSQPARDAQKKSELPEPRILFRVNPVGRQL